MQIKTQDPDMGDVGGNDYLARREAQIAANVIKMQELLVEPVVPIKSETSRQPRSLRRKNTSLKKIIPRKEYSLRSKSEVVSKSKQLKIDLEDVEESLAKPRKKYEKSDIHGFVEIKYPDFKQNKYGHIPGIPIGAWWEFRMDVGKCGIHRSIVGGIHGSQDDCYSLALSGGYEDDIDNGETFTYTGSGGRDLTGTATAPKNLRTAPQSKDQQFTGKNLGLKISCDKGRVVRVIRGYKLKSIYGPSHGYRYDGLYKVKKYWLEKGISKFNVCRFELERLPNQPPLPTREL